MQLEHYFKENKRNKMWPNGHFRPASIVETSPWVFVSKLGYCGRRNILKRCYLLEFAALYMELIFIVAKLLSSRNWKTNVRITLFKFVLQVKPQSGLYTRHLFFAYRAEEYGLVNYREPCVSLTV